MIAIMADGTAEIPQRDRISSSMDERHRRSRWRHESGPQYDDPGFMDRRQPRTAIPYPITKSRDGVRRATT